MKLSTYGRAALAAAVSLGMALGITACGVSNTVDFLYVASARNNPGIITAFQVDRLSGALTQITSGVVPTGGRNPIAMVTSPDGKNLYVANHDENLIAQFAIGSDGKLYPQTTINTRGGTNPDAIAISPGGTVLYVVDAFANGFSPTNPGPGAVVAIPLGKNGILPANGNQNSSSFAVCNNPVAINVLADGSALYVVNDPGGQLPVLADVNGSSNTGASGSSILTYPVIGSCSGGVAGPGNAGPFGQISTFQVANGTTLTPAAGSPFTAGVAPTAVATDPSQRFLYVTDSRSNNMIGYQLQPGGVIAPLTNSSSNLFPTDSFPVSLTVDPRGLFIYVAAFGGNSVNAFAIDANTGIPSRVATGSYGVGTSPTAVLVEPALGRYVYTADFIGGTASGLFITNPGTGALTQVQNTPFNAGSQVTSLAAVRHGDFKSQVTTKF